MTDHFAFCQTFPITQFHPSDSRSKMFAVVTDSSLRISWLGSDAKNVSTFQEYNDGTTNLKKICPFSGAKQNYAKNYRKGKAVQPYTLEASRGEWSTSLLSLCTSGKDPQYSLNRRVYGPHSVLGRFGEEQKVLYLPDSNLGRSRR
jgi:hypothetical protein